MRFRAQRILLANLVSHEPPQIFRRAVLRAGLGYISQALRDSGRETAILDLSLGGSGARLLAEIRRFQPDVLGVSLFTYRYARAYELLALVKERFPRLPIIAGGPHVSTVREQVLYECPAIDLGVVGEGEDTIVSICAGADPAGLPGILMRADDDEVVFTGDRAPAAIEGSAFPRYEGFRLGDYPSPGTPVEDRVIPIVSSRGCPYNCIYCPVKAAIGSKYRFRSAAHIMAEIAYWYERGYRRFAFIDDNFTLLRERVMELCRAMISAGMRGLSCSLPNGARADTLDGELLTEMKRAGFTHIAIAVESASDAILAVLRKHETVAQITRAVESSRAAGLTVELFFLVGSPTETARDVERSIAFARAYPGVHSYFFNLIPYPGTELFVWVQCHGRFLRDSVYYLNHMHSNLDEPVFDTPEFPAAERRRMLRAARRAVQDHASAALELRLRARGIPGPLVRVAARAYASQTIQRAFHDVPLLRALRRLLA